MVKINKPKGLIRYASYNSIKDGVSRLMTARVLGYSVVLLALVSLLSFSLLTRSDVETNVFKVSGTLFQRSDDGFITNLYNIEFINKTFEDLPLQIKVESPASASLVKPDGTPITVQAGSFLKTIYFIKIPAENITTAKTVVTLGVYHHDKLLEEVKVKFIGPVSNKSKNPSL
jgi:polyferredoxin